MFRIGVINIQRGLQRPIRRYGRKVHSVGVTESPFSQYGVSLAKSGIAIGLSMGVGDAICQYFEGGRMNVERTTNMWLIGTFITGPISYTWQVVVERLIPGQTMPVILKKTAANSVYAFCLSLPVMFCAVTLMSRDDNGRRKTLTDVKHKIQQDLLPTFTAGAVFWPAVNIGVFRFVAVQNRALVSSLFGTVWNIYLSMKANSETRQHHLVDRSSPVNEADPQICL